MRFDCAHGSAVGLSGPVAETTAGPIRGKRAGSTDAFLGVPYARPPVGPLRFTSPRPPQRWGGIREARAFRPPFVQTELGAGSEDALYANIWTPDRGGELPVLIYIHGGGWAVHSSTIPTYDGAFLAERGGVVVVTFNYRMGMLGFGLHEELRDPETGYCANWGLQDQAALVDWVRKNAAAFGGDPANITVVGTSAGGSSAWQLALMPRTSRLIRRIVPISAAHVWQPAYALTPGDARAAFERVAGRGRPMAELRTADARSLVDRWACLFPDDPSARTIGTGRKFRGPVVDGEWMRGYDFELPTPNVPMLVINTHNEGSFYTRGSSPAPVDGEQLHAMVRALLRCGMPEAPDSLVRDVIAHYRGCAEEERLPDDPLSLYTEIYGDGFFRYQIVRLAERHARESEVEQYYMDFGYTVRPPGFGSPHEATSPFLFGTHGIPLNIDMFGDGAPEEHVSAAFVDLVASFAHTGRPSGTGLPVWPEFSPQRPSTMRLGDSEGPRVESVPKHRQLRVWDEIGWLAEA